MSVWSEPAIPLQELVCKSHLIWVIKGSLIHSQGLWIRVLVGRMWSPNEWALGQSPALLGGVGRILSLFPYLLAVRIILLSLSPEHPHGFQLVRSAWDEFCWIYWSDGTTPQQSVEPSMWINLSSVSLRAFKQNKTSLSIFTRLCSIVVWDPVEEWSFSHPSSSPDRALSNLV